MQKGNFYTLEASEKELIFQDISNRTGMPAFAVEKDWWVTQALTIIFEMEVGQSLVFKGGTSLSKAWKLIQRFSEDVDLAIDRTFLGFEGDLSKKQRTNLRKQAGIYTTGPFCEELKARFIAKGFHDVSFEVVPAEDSDQDPRIILIHYPNLIETPDYVLPRVQIEVGCRSLREPYTVKKFGSIVDEIYEGGEFTSPLIAIPTVNPERTFLEKLFLLHEEFHRPMGKMRVDRLSRHLYDVHQLANSEVAEKAINDKDLYETIVNHRFTFSKVGGVDYNSLNPKTLNSTPIPEVIEAWKADYQKMREQMIYEEKPPTFDELLASIEKLKARLSKLEWSFSLEFPKG
ncbi:nucleotidyl transferase AbiEii/AbiGii toxin family protein [Algoriphagus sp. C2-6-M1]|uniref:nucleotidyl transferase AbiEii/AbiGii toxin family protein n=1 Tax=Algoriphagus persicinus TaxID=3108754 RepID=UPI002B3EFD8B|nr:nucleotidyl transferase AbiEii/AbiGii toxin family protein [Algoriphagus sp. C2-6-M1]MEB2780768.1 nucleotidyl transferase AbiEii/AbiGii toxin family protein [Algoriphagus sp. C2-6-M1]